MSNVFTTIAGQEIVWTDPAGTTHLCEGADVHPGVRLLWTRCARGEPAPKAAPGILHIPAGCAWLRRPHDFVTCTACVDRKIGAMPKEFV